MGKLPASLFYWGDWARDLEEYSLEVEGAWIRICCKLSFAEPRGTLSRTVVQWAKILRETPEKTLLVLQVIQKAEIGDISPVLEGFSITSNENVMVSCRRMIKDEKARQDNRDRVYKYRSKEECNGSVMKKKRKCNASRVRVTETENESLETGTGTLETEVLGKEKVVMIEEIINYLNLKTGKHYKLTTPKTMDFIGLRMAEGFSVQNFKTVIDVKTKEWKKGSDMAKFLRPETLFGTKFEGYLNQEDGGGNGTNKAGGLLAEPGKYAAAGERKIE